MVDSRYFETAGYGRVGKMQDLIEDAYRKEEKLYSMRSYDLHSPYTPDNKEINRQLRFWAYVEKTALHTRARSVKSETNNNPDL